MAYPLPGFSSSSTTCTSLQKNRITFCSILGTSSLNASQLRERPKKLTRPEARPDIPSHVLNRNYRFRSSRVLRPVLRFIGETFPSFQFSPLSDSSPADDFQRIFRPFRDECKSGRVTILSKVLSAICQACRVWGGSVNAYNGADHTTTAHHLSLACKK